MLIRKQSTIVSIDGAKSGSETVAYAQRPRWFGRKLGQSACCSYLLFHCCFVAYIRTRHRSPSITTLPATIPSTRTVFQFEVYFFDSQYPVPNATTNMIVIFHLQFLIVSLKDGMFNNANVLFKTKFQDGVSTVTRHVPFRGAKNANDENMPSNIEKQRRRVR
ncbi:structural maintenance of chromosome 2 [Clonorchis sinensis]|uniref:Structural maintenance of chromosome 2 n=1 Tax=Clonorchis sinensis TaxID=79923 RepID=G7Y7G1_CLOSI|nr:structural maintenance of chromosome 2 [Clonorchis sinensis]